MPLEYLHERYINPFTDFGFKRLFGTEMNKELLIDFLNELLQGKNHIQTLRYQQNEHFAQTEFDRKAVFDLYCENQRGEKFIIELQKAKQNYFKDRTIYYSTFPIQEQAMKGEWDYRLNAVYTVGILDFVFDDVDRDQTVVNEVKLIDTGTHRIFYDKLTYIYLQMPNFDKSEDELESHFDRWLYVLKNLSALTDRPAKLQERIFSRLFEAAEILKLTSEERQAYEESLKHYRDLKNVIDTAREEGHQEGKEEGIGIGREEGIGIGREEGISIGEKRGEQNMVQKIAREMLSRGLSVEIIMEISGLSSEEIANLQLTVSE